MNWYFPLSMIFYCQKSIMHINHLIAGSNTDNSNFLNVSRKTKLICMVAFSIMILTIIAILLPTLYGTQGIIAWKKNDNIDLRISRCRRGHHYNIILCFIGPDNCRTYPCMHEGICAYHNSTHTCECKAGFRGDRCEESKKQSTK